MASNPDPGPPRAIRSSRPLWAPFLNPRAHIARHARHLTHLAAAASVPFSPLAATATATVAAAAAATSGLVYLGTSQTRPPLLPLASTTASSSSSSPSSPPSFPLPPFSLLAELREFGELHAVVAQAAGRFLVNFGPMFQKFLERQLEELHSKGCPTTSAVLRAHLYGAAVQVATLGLATRLLLLDRAAIVRGQVWRLVSWTLVHGGALHLLANYLTLAQLGPQLERLAGRERFIAVYCGSGAVATVFSLALNGGRASVGSSGALFGLIGALWRYDAAHAPYLPADSAAARVSARRLELSYLLGYHLLLWSKLDIGAHVGGALAGWTLAALLGPDFHLDSRTQGLGAVGDLVSALVGLPSALLRAPFRSGAGGTPGGEGTAAQPPAPPRAGAGMGSGWVFRDRPPVPTFADPQPRSSIPFPELGANYSISAAAAAAAVAKARAAGEAVRGMT